jgi:hypothetical protein
LFFFPVLHALFRHFMFTMPPQVCFIIRSFIYLTGAKKVIIYWQWPPDYIETANDLRALFLSYVLRLAGFCDRSFCMMVL